MDWIKESELLQDGYYWARNPTNGHIGIVHKNGNTLDTHFVGGWQVIFNEEWANVEFCGPILLPLNKNKRDV